jgi:hypothetical protein
MKIKTVFSVSEYDDYRSNFTVIVDGKEVLDCGDGEPEDNTLYRNFSDILGVAELMKMAYEAGKRGEELEIEEERNGC